MNAKLLIVILFAITNCFSQAFKKHVIFSNEEISGPQLDEYIDLDNNNHLDKISMSYDHWDDTMSSLSVYVFYDYFTGNNNDDEYRIKISGSHYALAYSMTFLDYNNDNYKDILISLDSNIYFYKNNTDKTYRFDYKISNPKIQRAIKAIDKNNDGFEDLFLLNDQSNGIMINNGNGAFSPPVYKTSYRGYPFYERFKIIDYNNDGKKDIVQFSNNSNTYNATLVNLYQNSSDSFLLRNINNPVIAIGDISNVDTGQVYVVGCDAYTASGVFLGTKQNDSIVYNKLVNIDVKNTSQFILLEDIDNDNLTDILYSTFGRPYNKYDSLFYLKNLGNGSFQKILIDAKSGSAFSAAKVIREGSRTFIECKLDVYGSTIDPYSSIFYEVVNSTTFKKWYDRFAIEDMRFQDINNDGLVDIVCSTKSPTSVQSSSLGKLYSIINKGSLKFDKPQQLLTDDSLISNSKNWIYKYDFFDINNDNYKDIILMDYEIRSTVTNKSAVYILYLLNDHNNKFHFYRKQFLDSLYSNTSVVDITDIPSFAQLNNSNTIELIFNRQVLTTSSTIYYSINKSGSISPRYDLPFIYLPTSSSSYYTYLSCDFDGDGYKDIVQAGYMNRNPTFISWYKNNRNNTFTLYSLKYDSIPYRYGSIYNKTVYFADITGDNKKELLFSFGYMQKKETTDSFKVKHYNIPYKNYQSPYNYIDYNNDGYSDLLLRYPFRIKETSVNGTYVKDAIGLYLNRKDSILFSDSNFVLIDTSKYFENIDTYNLDMDNDGDIDVVSFDNDYEKIDPDRKIYDAGQIFPKGIEYTISATRLNIYENKTTNRITGLTSTINKNNSIKIFPNPTNDILNIEWQVDKLFSAKEMFITLYDITGKVIQQFNADAFQKALTISVNNYYKGMYFLRFEADREIIGTEKFIIQ